MKSGLTNRAESNIQLTKREATKSVEMLLGPFSLQGYHKEQSLTNSGGLADEQNEVRILAVKIEVELIQLGQCYGCGLH